MNYYKKIIKYFVAIFILFFTNCGIIFASSLKDTSGMGLQTTAFEAKAGFNREVLVENIVATIIQALLGLLGIIFLILLIYAGFHWMTAAGEEEKVKKATDTIKMAVIGLIIIVCAYLITIFVFSKLPTG